jgi:hypothetical protein
MDYGVAPRFVIHFYYYPRRGLVLIGVVLDAAPIRGEELFWRLGLL